MENQYIKSFWVAHSEKVNLVELPGKEKKKPLKQDNGQVQACIKKASTTEN